MKPTKTQNIKIPIDREMSNLQANNGTASSSSGGDTNNGNSTHTNVEDSESIASDESEEMIEVDEDEFDRLRAILVADMRELEMQFAKLKEELIAEKMLLSDQKAKEIEDDTAQEFKVQIEKLKHTMDTKINLAGIFFDANNFSLYQNNGWCFLLFTSLPNEILSITPITQEKSCLKIIFLFKAAFFLLVFLKYQLKGIHLSFY